MYIWYVNERLFSYFVKIINAVAADMDTAKSRYHYPGEHTYRGILCDKNFPADVLREVEESLTLTQKHVVIASYPKSGQLT